MPHKGPRGRLSSSSVVRSRPRVAAVRRAALRAALGLCAALPAGAVQVTSTWKAGVVGNWDDATKWTNSPAAATFPNNGNLSNTYDAVLNSGTATLDVSAALRNLTLSGGSIDATGTYLSPGTSAITLTGNFNFNSGGYRVPITVPPTGTLTLSPGAGKRLGNTLSMGGHVAFSNAGDVELLFDRPGRFNILPTGSFTLDRKLTLTTTPNDPFGNNNAYGVMENMGTMVASTGASFVGLGQTYLTNSGVLQVTAPFAVNAASFRNFASGLLDLTAATSVMTIDSAPVAYTVELSGRMRLAAGSVLNVNSGIVNLSASSVTNAGTINFGTETRVPGTATLPGVVNFLTPASKLVIETNAAQLTLTGPVKFDNGAQIRGPNINGPTPDGTFRVVASNLTLGSYTAVSLAEVSVPAGGTLHLAASGTNRLLIGGRISVDGTAEWAGGAAGALTSDSSLTSKVTIRAGGLMDVRASATATLDAASTHGIADTLTNAGLVNVADGATLALGKTWNLVNSGTVRVNAGTMSVASASASNSGTIDLRPGATLRVAFVTAPGANAAVFSVGSGGSVLVGDGATATLTATFSGSVVRNAGLVQVAGSGRFLTNNWDVTNSGTLRIADPAGRASMAGGSFDNSGTVRADAGTLELGAFQTTNRGVVEVLGAAVAQVAPTSDATFNNVVGARFSVGGSATAAFTTPSGSRTNQLVNAGTIDVGGGGRLTLGRDWRVTNSGVTRASNGGTIEVAGQSFTNTGRVELTAGATLAVAPAAGSFLGMTVQNSAGGVIAVGPSSAASFAGAASVGGLLTNAGTIEIDHARMTLDDKWRFSNGGTVTITSGVLKFDPRSFTNTGGIDLRGGGGLILAAPPGAATDPAARLKQAHDMLVTGYHAGAWDGAGIRSAAAASDATTGVGYAPAVATGIFLGVPLNPGDVLVRHTRYGDATLDGVVNFDDLLALAKSYNSTTAHWYQGDFNYSGTVNFDDLLVLAKNYGATLPAAGSVPGGTAQFTADLAAAFAQATVPEPGTGVVLTLGAGGIAAMRRKRGRRV